MQSLLQDLLVDRPTALVNHLVDLGVQTCEDVQGLWQSGGALLDEFERHHGTVAAEEGFTIVSFWTLASQRAQASQRQKLKEICIHRQSAISTSAPSRPEASPPPVARPVRRLLEIGEVREPPILVNLAAKDPYVKEQAAKVAKTQTLFELLVQDFLNLEELGVSRSQLRDATRMQLLKESVMPAADRLSVHRLGALVSTLRRWRDFATRLGFDVQQPSPLQLNTFLKEVARGGPTAASSMFHALNWFRSQFGIPFPLDHWLVRSYKLLPVGHTSQQKLELQPWEFVNLILKLRQSSGTNTMVLAFLLWAAVSCIRFEHIQRSKFDRCEANALFFTCSQGKARRQGARPAFQWAMPEIPWPGFSLVKIIQDFVTMELLPGGTYLWPALQLDPLDLWQVTEHTPWKLDRKLSRGRFLELLRGALLDLGTASDQAQTAGFNRLRRFLPTLGNVFRLSPQDQQAVGNWVEIPTGGGPIPNQKSRATWTMGIHYSGQRALHSAQVKKALLKRFMRLYNAKKAELALTDDGLHPRDCWTWAEVAAQNEQLGDLGTELPAPPPVESSPDLPEDASTARGSADVRELPVHVDTGPEPEPEAPDNESASDTSSTSSGSASDVSNEATDLEGALSNDDVAVSTHWLVQGTKVHIIRGETDGRLLPWCRDAPFSQDCRSTGEGFSTVSCQRFCQRCLARMPRGLYRALSRHCGWLN